MGKIATKAKLRRPAVLKDSKAPYGKKQKTNAAFKTDLGLAYSGISKTPRRSGNTLRGLDQITYQEVHSMSQKKALAFLTKAGVCPTSKSMSFVCWNCKKDMQANGSGFRCQNRSCSQRPRLTAPQVAFTPLFGFASNGTDIDYAMLLRTSFTVGAKLSNDSAIQMLRMPGQSLSSAEHKVDDFYTKIKVAMAYAETKYSRSVQFKDEIVEPDSGRMGVAKTAEQKIHLGRTLVLKGRFTKKWIAKALPNTVSKPGRGMGAESRAEVDQPIKDAMGAGTIGAPDGSRAFHGALRDAGKPSLPGVNHMKKVFTPIARVLKSSIDARTKRMLEKKCKSKGSTKAAVAETKRYFKVAAGDSSAENTVGCIKKVMRRMGNLGRTRSTGLQKNVQAMASAALHRQCGFDRVLAALREYRLDCSNGTVQMAPKDAFLHDKCKWILD